MWTNVPTLHLRIPLLMGLATTLNHAVACKVLMGSRCVHGARTNLTTDYQDWLYDLEGFPSLSFAWFVHTAMLKVPLALVHSRCSVQGLSGE